MILGLPQPIEFSSIQRPYSKKQSTTTNKSAKERAIENSKTSCPESEDAAFGSDKLLRG
jgi:hypothetical protein